jgi:hypothetical protein
LLFAPVPENFADGLMKFREPATCVPLMRDMPAGLKNTVLASSAIAAPPAYVTEYGIVD